MDIAGTFASDLDPWVSVPMTSSLLLVAMVRRRMRTPLFVWIRLVRVRILRLGSRGS